MLPDSLIYSWFHYSRFEDCVATTLMEWGTNQPVTFYYNGALRRYCLQHAASWLQLPVQCAADASAGSAATTAPCRWESRHVES